MNKYEENKRENRKKSKIINKNAIDVINLTFGYSKKKIIFNEISFSIKYGEIIALAGESGSGKSTLLYILKGLIPKEIRGYLKGNIYVDGKNVKKTKIVTLAQTIGMVFQDLDAQLFSNSVLEEIQFGLNNFGLDPNNAWNVLEKLEIVDLARQIPMNLSAGQKQRVILACVLALQPKILLLDEPSVHLDYKNKKQLRDWLKNLNETTGMTIIIASNDSYLIGELCNEILFIEDSKIARRKKEDLMREERKWEWIY